MAVDIKNLFDKQLPEAISKNPDKAAEIGHVFQMNVTGPTGGNWTINTTKNDGGPSCVAGTVTNAECTINIADEDFQKLVENPQANGMQLFFAGKLKVQGNQMLAMKLSKLFDLAK
ncbi:MAG: SCP2 sterol-binding domain-containing protein [Deltaproteobacteria bacterium]|nr:SCP2 sterol-binding domain-containing protein [Deltaproteobacteria bacterium]